MAFAQSFLAGAQLATREQDRRQQLLTALIGRRPAGGGISVAGGGAGAGGDPLSRIRKIEREREDEETRASLLAQQTQLNQELIEQQRLANVKAESELPTDLEAQERLYAPAQRAQEQYEQTIREMPFAQAEELEGRRRVEAGIQGVENQQRAAARRQHMDCYASRDVDCLKRTWRNMFPGAQFGAEFKMGPNGMPMIKYPGEDEWDVYDQGAFRQAAVYAANPQLEQPIAGGGQAGMPGVSAMVGQDIQQGFVAPAQTPTQAGVRAAAPGVSPAAGMKGPTWKQYQDVINAQEGQKVDAWKAAHDIVSERHPMTDEMGMAKTGAALEEAKAGYEKEFKEVLGMLSQNKNLRSLGVQSPTAGLTRKDENTAIVQANEQWKKYTERDGKRYRIVTNPDGSTREEEVSPQAYWDMLWGQVSPRVAVGWAKKNAKDLLEPSAPPPALEGGRLPIEQLMEQEGVVRTGEYPEISEGAQPMFPGLVERPPEPGPPAQPAPGMQIPPGQIMREREPQRMAQREAATLKPGQTVPDSPIPVITAEGPLTVGDQSVSIGYDQNQNPITYIIDPTTGLPRRATNQDAQALREEAARAVDPNKISVLNSLLAAMGRSIRRAAAREQMQPGSF